MGRLARLLALGAAIGAMTTTSAAAAAGLPRLTHAGRWLTDPHGRVVVLHGENMVYKVAPYTPAAAGFGADDAAFLRRAGFDAVRVGVIWKAVEPQPGVYDDAYLDSIASTVRTLAAHGIRSLLDFHQDLYNERFQGEGAPDWAVLDDGLPAEPKVGFPGNYTMMPALQHAFDNFLADRPGPGGVGLQERLAAAWQHVAQRFAGQPGVLGYEILNEPFPGTGFLQCAGPTGCPEKDAQLTALDHKVAQAIRTADPATMVFYEPFVLFNFGAPARIGALGDPQAGFAFHDYCLTGDRCSTEEDVLANADRRVASTHEALVLTEYGATKNAGALRHMVALADSHRTSWLEWQYCACNDITTSANPRDQALVYDPHRPPADANVAAATLAALAEPYPRVVAGTPRGWRFDRSTKTFTLTFRTRAADGRRTFPPGSVTEIAAPRVAYPHGYRVRVVGATVTSRAGAPVVRIASRRGARTVSVTLAGR